MTTENTIEIDNEGVELEEPSESFREVKRELINKGYDDIFKTSVFKGLKSLRCFEEVHKKVCNGASIAGLARWVQDERLERLDVKRETLIRTLYRYRNALPPALLLKDEEELYVRQAVRNLNRGVNEVEELEVLYLLQLKRISIDAKTESKINKLFKNTGAEIKLAKDILKDMHDLKKELGLIDVVPEKIEFSGGLEFSGNNQEIPEETKIKLGIVAEKLIDTLANSREDDLKETITSHD